MFHAQRGSKPRMDVLVRHGKCKRTMSTNFLSKRTRTRSSMAKPECADRGLSNPVYAREWSERSWVWMQNRRKGGEVALQQARFDELGGMLREVRREQRRSLDDMAEALSVDPDLLCFLESGWGTEDEFLTHIDGWAGLLGLDVVSLRETFLPVVKK